MQHIQIRKSLYTTYVHVHVRNYMSTMAIEFKDMCRAMNFSAVDVDVSTIEKIRMCIDKMNRYVE